MESVQLLLLLLVVAVVAPMVVAVAMQLCSEGPLSGHLGPLRAAKAPRVRFSLGRTASYPGMTRLRVPRQDDGAADVTAMVVAAATAAVPQAQPVVRNRVETVLRHLQQQARLTEQRLRQLPSSTCESTAQGPPLPFETVHPNGTFVRSRSADCPGFLLGCV
jgi:hypothetical protein